MTSNPQWATYADIPSICLRCTEWGTVRSNSTIIGYKCNLDIYPEIPSYLKGGVDYLNIVTNPYKHSSECPSYKDAHLAKLQAANTNMTLKLQLRKRRDLWLRLSIIGLCFVINPVLGAVAFGILEMISVDLY